MNHRDLPDAGQIPHQVLDQLHTLFTTGQLRLQVATPDAELDAAFGTPAEVGPGFLRLLNDNAGGANLYLIASDGTNWWILTSTKAV